MCHSLTFSYVLFLSPSSLSHTHTCLYMFLYLSKDAAAARASVAPLEAHVEKLKLELISGVDKSKWNPEQEQVVSPGGSRVEMTHLVRPSTILPDNARRSEAPTAEFFSQVSSCSALRMSAYTHTRTHTHTHTHTRRARARMGHGRFLDRRTRTHTFAHTGSLSLSLSCCRCLEPASRRQTAGKSSSKERCKSSRERWQPHELVSARPLQRRQGCSNTCSYFILPPPSRSYEHGLALHIAAHV